MKVAIAGFGTMGKVYAAKLMKMDHVRLVGIYNRSEESVKPFSDEHGIAYFSSFERMATEAEPDVICITLPTFLHKEYVLKAASLGKHVICEKPIAMSPADAAEMIRACETNGVRLFVAHVVRFTPECRHLRKSIEAGDIGRIGVAHAKRAGAFPSTSSNWYADASRSGGVIMDLMIHDIDLMRWINGEVRSVYALTRRSAEISYALVTLRFRGGAIANLEGFWGYPGSFASVAEFAGTLGIIRLNNQSSNAVKLMVAAKSPEKHKGVAMSSSLSIRDAYYEELIHFLDCIASGAEPIVTASDAVKALEIALAAIDSAQSGLPVLLPETADWAIGN